LCYNFNALQTTIQNMSLGQYYITYGDAPVNNMYAILTNPFKRIYVQAGLGTNKKMPANAPVNIVMKIAVELSFRFFEEIEKYLDKTRFFLPLESTWRRIAIGIPPL